MDKLKRLKTQYLSCILTRHQHFYEQKSWLLTMKMMLTVRSVIEFMGFAGCYKCRRDVSYLIFSTI